MGERPRVQQEAAKSEVDSVTGGPGLVATKSQAQGSLIGLIVGAIAGAVIGLIVGLIVDLIVVTTIVGAVAGAVVAAVAGGGQRPKQRLDGSEADA